MQKAVYDITLSIEFNNHYTQIIKFYILHFANILTVYEIFFQGADRLLLTPSNYANVVNKSYISSMYLYPAKISLDLQSVKP